MESSGLWRHRALVGTDVSDESVQSIMSLERISELEPTLAVTSN
jgi:hypothetical protein